MAEHAMLDLVPLGGSWREVADLDRELEFVSQLLQLSAPQAYPIAIASPAVSGDEQTTCTWIDGLAHLVPPASNTLRSKLCGVVVDTNIDPSSVGCQVIDPIGCYLAELGIDEVIDSYLLWRANRLVLSASILEVTDQLLLLGID